MDVKGSIRKNHEKTKKKTNKSQKDSHNKEMKTYPHDKSKRKNRKSGYKCSSIHVRGCCEVFKSLKRN